MPTALRQHKQTGKGDKITQALVGTMYIAFLFTFPVQMQSASAELPYPSIVAA